LKTLLNDDIVVETSNTNQIRLELTEFLNTHEFVGKLKSNYTYEKVLKTHYNYDILDTNIAVSLVKQTGSIVSFSTIHHKSIWGNNYRILNRYYKVPSFRFRDGPIVNKQKWSTVGSPVSTMAKQQYEFCKNTLGPDAQYMFVSRQGSNNAALKKYVNQWGICEWICPPNKFPVTGIHEQQGQQWIAYAPIGNYYEN
jgi:hypothetical protein